MLDLLKGKKTYIAAIGLALLGLSNYLAGNAAAAYPLFAQALGLFGLRQAIKNLGIDSTPTPPAPPATGS